MSLEGYKGLKQFYLKDLDEIYQMIKIGPFVQNSDFMPRKPSIFRTIKFDAEPKLGVEKGQ